MFFVFNAGCVDVAVVIVAVAAAVSVVSVVSVAVSRVVLLLQFAVSSLLS